MRGTSAGTEEIVRRINDPYLEMVDREELIRTHHDSAFLKYNLLAWLADNLTGLQSFADPYLYEGEIPKRIFMFWDKGWDKAPEIVLACRKSVEEVFPDFELCFLDSKNYSQWVTREDMSKHIEGLMSKSMANWTDWLRTVLLAKYGGFWVDASVYITRDMRRIINQVDISGKTVWAQRIYPRQHQISSWLLYGKGYTFALLWGALNLWFETYEEFPEYFFYHTLWFFLSQIDNKFKAQWNTTPYLVSREGFQLWKQKDEVVSDMRFKELLSIAPAHKLSVRYEAGRMIDKNTVVGRILNTKFLR